MATGTGKTIIFAQNKAHAQYIVSRFDALYPQYRGGFCARIVCDDTYAQSLIDDFKLRNNLPLTPDDYQALTAILMKDLGNPEDYQREFGDTPLGLLVRKAAKMERDAAMQAFSSFINEQNLNQQQIVFVHKIVDYVVENGYIESIKVLMLPPFDKPQNFLRLFSDTERKQLMQIVDSIRDNAMVIKSA